jgi:hypothetical protein
MNLRNVAVDLAEAVARTPRPSIDRSRSTWIKSANSNVMSSDKTIYSRQYLRNIRSAHRLTKWNQLSAPVAIWRTGSVLKKDGCL